MKILKGIVFVLLICIAAALLSCGGADGGGDSAAPDQNSPATGSNPDAENEAPAEEEAEITAASAVESLQAADYGGYEFRIWTSNWFNTTLEGRQAPEEEQIGEPINDALWLRDKLIEEKYNITLKYTIYDPDPNAFASAAVKTVKSGDDAFDFAMGDMMNVSKGLAQTGAIYDFNVLPNIDLENEWWSKYARRDLTINGKFYFPTGDISARFPGSQAMLFFNKKIFSDMGIDLPYQTVLDGKWTFDVFKDIIKGQTRDLNGDGIFDGSDFYGFLGNASGYNLFRSAGEGIIRIEDGNPVINVGTERSVSIQQALNSFMGDVTYMYYKQGFQSYDEVPMFKEDRLMFLIQTGTNASLYRDMESDFGIMPLPKYDENQSEYYAFCQKWGSVAVCVPRTNQNTERTGMVIEALAAAGKYTSTVAAYDVTLKRKYARDDESEKMLDIIVEGSCYDMAMMFNWGSIFSNFYEAMDKGENFISKFESIEPKVIAAMEKTIDIFMGGE